MILVKLFLAVAKKGLLSPLAKAPIILSTPRTTFMLLSLMSLRITSQTGLKSVFASLGTEASLTNSYIMAVF